MAVKKRVIHDPETGEPYLIRWSIFPGLKVHRILRADVIAEVEARALPSR